MAGTEQQVAELYVATFNRAPDAAGLAYWVDSVLTIDQIAQSFFDQTETQALYPAENTNTEFVTSIYANLFNRVPDAEGLAYWVAALDDGITTRDVMILATVNGAQDTDAEIVANKTEVGLYYSGLGLNGTYSLASVTEDDATVTAAQADIDTYVPQTTALATGADTVTGGNGDDTVTGVLSSLSSSNTLNATDSIDGGVGTDTLDVSVSTNFTGFTTGSVANVENINLTNTSSINRTFDATGITGAETYTLAATGQGFALTDLAATPTVALSDQASGTFSIAFAVGAAELTGTTDAMTFQVSGVGTVADATTTPAVAEAAVAATLTDIEVVNLEATGANVLSFAGTDLKTLNIAGDGTAKITAVPASLTAFDATENTGGVTADLTATTSTLTTIAGGSGDDSITMATADVVANATIAGGAGADTLSLISAAGGTVQYVQTGFETLTLADIDGVLTYSGANATDITTINTNTLNTAATALVNMGSGNFTVNNLGANAAGGDLSSTHTGTTTLNYTATAAAVAAKTAQVSDVDYTFSGSTGLTVNAGAYTDTTGSAISAASAASVTVNVASGMSSAAVPVETTEFDSIITANSATSLTVAATGELGANAAISSTSATGASVTNGATAGDFSLVTPALTDLTVTTGNTLDFTGSTLTGVQVANISGTLGTVTVTDLNSISSLTVGGTGATSAAAFGALGNGVANDYDMTVTATGLVGGLTIGTMDAVAASDITLDVSGVTGAVTQTGAFGANVTDITVSAVGTGGAVSLAATDDIVAAGNVSITGSSVGAFTTTDITAATGNVTIDLDGTIGAVTLAQTEGLVVDIDVSDTIGGVTWGGATDVTATTSLTLAGSSLAANDVDVSIAAAATSFTGNLTGGILVDDIDFVAAAGATLASVVLTGAGDLGTDLLTVDVSNATIATGVTVNTSAVSGFETIDIIGSAEEDTIVVGGAATDTNSITAGDEADSVTMGSGIDTFVQTTGDGIASNTQTFAAATSIAAGDTVTFAAGVDTITGFTAAADFIDGGQAGALATIIGLNEGALTATANIFASGAYVAATGVFTIAADGTGADTMIVDTTYSADIDANDGIIILIGVDSDDLTNANFI